MLFLLKYEDSDSAYHLKTSYLEKFP